MTIKPFSDLPNSAQQAINDAVNEMDSNEDVQQAVEECMGYIDSAMTAISDYAQEHTELDNAYGQLDGAMGDLMYMDFDEPEKIYLIHGANIFHAGRLTEEAANELRGHKDMSDCTLLNIVELHNLAQKLQEHFSLSRKSDLEKIKDQENRIKELEAAYDLLKQNSDANEQSAYEAGRHDEIAQAASLATKIVG